MSHHKYFAAFILIFLCAQPILSQSFNLKMADDSIKLIPRGRVYMDGATFIEDKSDLSSGVAIPDIRLGMIMDYGRWSTKIDIGFGKGKVAAKDVFVQYNFRKASFLRAGHYSEPFGIDNMESSGDIKFMTDNAASNVFSPNRNIGIEYTGWTEKFWYAAGVFGDGNSMVGDKDGDDGYATTGRVVFNPLRKTGAIFHIGMAGSFRKADANGRRAEGEELNDNKREVIYSSSLLTKIDNFRPLKATISDANYQAKYAIELIGAYRTVFFQSEYFHTNVKRTSNHPTYMGQGGYAQLGFLLLGSDYTYSSSYARMDTPHAKSLELVGRFGYTNLNDKRSDIYGGTMRDWSLAINYYLNRFVMLRFNYSYINMGDYNPVLAGENVHVIQGRMQIIF